MNTHYQDPRLFFLVFDLLLLPFLWYLTYSYFVFGILLLVCVISIPWIAHDVYIKHHIDKHKE